ncbi:MAG: Rrf2 family transcriptional regulator [Nitrospirae bacterium]|nr:Rrf2 family transcriptional regulator [Nitrospirota bacterium]
MYEIAKGYPNDPITIREIAQKQDVSIPYLEQILGRLRKTGLIKSVKGPGGGYLLTSSPDKVTIGAIVMDLEGPVAITSCLDPEEGCVKIDGCVVHLLWRALGRQIEEFLNTITLVDLLEGKHFEAQVLLAASTSASTLINDEKRDKTVSV